MEILIPTKCIAWKLSWIQYQYKTSRSVYILNLDLIIFKILINRKSSLFTKSLLIHRDANNTFRSLQDLFLSKKQSEVDGFAWVRRLMRIEEVVQALLCLQPLVTNDLSKRTLLSDNRQRSFTPHYVAISHRLVRIRRNFVVVVAEGCLIPDTDNFYYSLAPLPWFGRHVKFFFWEDVPVQTSSWQSRWKKSIRFLRLNQSEC